MLGTAGPDMRCRELLGQHVCQPLDAKALAGKMAGQQQTDSGSFGLDAGMKPRLARDQTIAAQGPRGSEKLAGAATGHGHTLDLAIRFTDELQMLDGQEPLEIRGQLLECPWRGTSPATAARAG